jgi:hypothetical protein
MTAADVTRRADPIPGYLTARRLAVGVGGSRRARHERAAWGLVDGCVAESVYKGQFEPIDERTAGT